jgi:hypothetical protein
LINSGCRARPRARLPRLILRNTGCIIPGNSKALSGSSERLYQPPSGLAGQTVPP